MSHSQKRGQEHFRRFCVHADMLPSRYLSSCVQNDFRIGTVAAILANKNEILICDNAVTAIRIGPFHLITQIDIVVFQKPNRGTVGKWIWQIYIRTGQQIQVIYRKSRDAESVYLTDQLTFQKRKVFVSLCDAAAAEGMSLAPFTPSACRQPVAFFAAIISAICRHTLYLRIKLEIAYFLDSKTTVSTWHEEMKLLNHTCTGKRELVHRPLPVRNIAPRNISTFYLFVRNISTGFCRLPVLGNMSISWDLSISLSAC